MACRLQSRRRPPRPVARNLSAIHSAAQRRRLVLPHRSAGRRLSPASATKLLNCHRICPNTRPHLQSGCCTRLAAALRSCREPARVAYYYKHESVRRRVVVCKERARCVQVSTSILKQHAQPVVPHMVVHEGSYEEGVARLGHQAVLRDDALDQHGGRDVEGGVPYLQSTGALSHQIKVRSRRADGPSNIAGRAPSAPGLRTTVLGTCCIRGCYLTAWLVQHVQACLTSCA